MRNFLLLFVLGLVVQVEASLGARLRLCWASLVQSKVISRLSPDSDFEVGNEYYLVHGAQKTNRVRFLGIKKDQLDVSKEYLDNLSFLDLDTGKFFNIRRAEVLDFIPSNLRNYKTYTQSKTYKVHKLNGEVFNGIFLGEFIGKQRGQVLDGHLAFYNLESKAIQYVDDSNIFHVVQNEEARLAYQDIDLPGRNLQSDPWDVESAASFSLLRNSHKNIEFGIHSPTQQRLSPGQRVALDNFMRGAESALERFDAKMEGALRAGRVSRKLHIRFVDDPTKRAYTFAEPTEVGGRDRYFVRLPIDLKREDLGLSIGTLLHERGHHYATNSAIAKDKQVSLIEDLAFKEGFSDYSAAQVLGDPSIARFHYDHSVWLRNIETREVLTGEGNKVLRSPLDATSRGVLEEHKLSVFYSYPMWSAYKSILSQMGFAQRESFKVSELWNEFFTKIEENDAAYDDYLFGLKGADAEGLSPESEYVRNIQFFYIHLYKEAFLNASSYSPQGVRAIQSAYNDSKKAFLLPWKEIERVATLLRENEIDTSARQSETN